jgi:pimeloyl-ACP methyl ester carboxylesterase
MNRHTTARARIGVALCLGALVASVVGGAVAGAATATASQAAASTPGNLTAGGSSGVALRPFGKLVCAPRNGFRLCVGGQVGGQDRRVPSFDKVPLDADLALPPTGSGPFPLIVLLHGLGESKSEYEVMNPDNGLDDATLAAKGYAVLMYTARGFGDSCGTKASRANTPACAKGWIQLADQRYEIRDTQFLAGELVDEGLAKPNIAVAGVSYGAGQSLELATLRNRMRLPSGQLVPFVSPVRRIPMSIAAAFAIWPWEDLVTSLDPNGGLSSVTYTPPGRDLVPVGVAKQSWITLLYGVTASYYLAPPNVDPQSNLTVWNREILSGEPYTAAEARALAILQQDKSAIGIPLEAGGPAPTAIQSGWTDSLFPVSEALHFANRSRAAHSNSPQLLMFADIGHGWASNKAADTAETTSDGLAFLDAIMLTHTRPPTGVVVIPQTCPASAPSGAPRTAATLAELQTGSLVLGGTTPQLVTSSGGDPAVSAALNPAYSGKPLCNPMPATIEPGTAVYEQPVGASGATLLGAVRIRLRFRVTGPYPEIVGRLWDVSPDGATRQIVALGVFRPSVNQAPGTAATATATDAVTFELNPNEYSFAPGHTVELELVGSNAPLFRKSNGTFRITVTSLSATVPLG